jgi:hypothetical protein
MSSIWRGAFSVKFKNTTVITFGDGSHSAEFTVDIIFNGRVTRKIMITAKFAKLREYAHHAPKAKSFPQSPKHNFRLFLYGLLGHFEPRAIFF